MSPKEKQPQTITIFFNLSFTIAPKQQFLFELHHKLSHKKNIKYKEKQTKEEKDSHIKRANTFSPSCSPKFYQSQKRKKLTKVGQIIADSEYSVNYESKPVYTLVSS